MALNQLQRAPPVCGNGLSSVFRTCCFFFFFAPLARHCFTRVQCFLLLIGVTGRVLKQERCCSSRLSLCVRACVRACAQRDPSSELCCVCTCVKDALSILTWLVLRSRDLSAWHVHTAFAGTLLFCWCIVYTACGLSMCRFCTLLFCRCPRTHRRCTIPLNDSASWSTKDTATRY